MYVCIYTCVMCVSWTSFPSFPIFLQVIPFSTDLRESFVTFIASEMQSGHSDMGVIGLHPCIFLIFPRLWLEGSTIHLSSKSSSHYSCVASKCVCFLYHSVPVQRSDCCRLWCRLVCVLFLFLPCFLFKKSPVQKHITSWHMLILPEPSINQA